jgi:tetratricopeptide (TPR) repeat protein
MSRKPAKKPAGKLKAIYRAAVPEWLRRLIHRKIIRQIRHAMPAPLSTKQLMIAADKARKAMRLDRSMRLLYQALSNDPDDAAVRHLAADVLAELGRRNEAIGLTRDLLAVYPLDLRAIKRLSALGSPVQIDRGEVLGMLMAEPSAIKTLDAMRVLNDGSFFRDAATLAASTVFADTDHIEMRAAITIEHAFAIESLGDLHTAIEIYETVPLGTKGRNRSASGHARCLLELGRIDEAEAVLRDVGAVVGGPIPYNVVLQAILYLRDDIRSAHLTYRHRKTSAILAAYFNKPDPTLLHIKDRSHANKKAFAFAEGGPGDEIRMASMYDKLSSYFAGLSVTCDPRLTSLLSRSFPSIDFIPTSRHRKEFAAKDRSDRSMITDQGLVAFVSNDSARAAEGAAYVFSTLDALTEFRGDRAEFRDASRLLPMPDLITKWQDITRSPRIKIAISWRSMLQSSTRDKHYLTVDDLAPLSKIENADFWIFQPLATADELESVKDMLPGAQVPNIDLRDDFEEQAAFLSAMDYVISPLTTTAELAGMVGTRTILLSTTHISSWRRNADGSDVWYENGSLVIGEPIWNRLDLVERVVGIIEAEKTERPTTSTNKPLAQRTHAVAEPKA